jgi:hypothetical protein
VSHLTRKSRHHISSSTGLWYQLLAMEEVGETHTHTDSELLSCSCIAHMHTHTEGSWYTCQPFLSTVPSHQPTAQLLLCCLLLPSILPINQKSKELTYMSTATTTNTSDDDEHWITYLSLLCIVVLQVPEKQKVHVPRT